MKIINKEILIFAVAILGANISHARCEVELRSDSTEEEILAANYLIGTPTLSYLYDNDESPIVSSYQLKEITEDNAAGAFSITKYIYYSDLEISAIKEFNLSFNNILGDTDGEYKYYSWATDSSGNLVLATGNANNYDIIAGASDNGTSYVGGTYGSSIISNSGSYSTNINADFIANSVSTKSTFNGGIINNTGSINTISGYFIGNVIESTSSTVYGGVIYNTEASIETIYTDFIANAMTGTSTYGIIYNANASIGDIYGDFIGNYVDSSYITQGGVIHNTRSTIDSITGDFIGNYVEGSRVYGGAIYNNSASIDAVTGDFIGNYVVGGYAYGGAIYNANSDDSSRGASITILAQENSVYFTGNYTMNDSGTKVSNAIYNTGSGSSDSAKATIVFNAYDDYKIVVNDGIDGNSSYIEYQVLEINSGDLPDGLDYSTVAFNNSVKNNTINVYNGTLKLGTFEADYIDVNGEKVYVDSSVASLTSVVLTVNDGANLSIGENATVEVSSSTITISSGATLKLEASSSIKLSDTSSLVFQDDAIIEVDLTGIYGDFEYILFDLSTCVGTLLNTDDISAILSVSSNTEGAISEASSANLGDSFYKLSTDSDGNIVLSGSISAAVPEPSTYAMILGIISLGFAYYRKRK